MAVYTDLTDAERDAVFAAFGLGPVHAFKGIAEGIENSNFLVHAAQGRFILTIFERRVARQDLPFDRLVLFYLPHPEGIELVRVLAGAQDLERVAEEGGFQG